MSPISKVMVAAVNFFLGIETKMHEDDEEEKVCMSVGVSYIHHEGGSISSWLIIEFKEFEWLVYKHVYSKQLYEVVVVAAVLVVQDVVVLLKYRVVVVVAVLITEAILVGLK